MNTNDGVETAVIPTFTGKRFNIRNPSPEDIDIRDIAHSLAIVSRYAGHLKCPYSVAEHSIRMYWAALRMSKRYLGMLDRRVPAWCLFHDAAEAYLGEFPRPVKRTAGIVINYLEDIILRTVADKFKLPWPIPAEVKEFDNQILHVEIAAMAKYPRTFYCPGSIVPFKDDLNFLEFGPVENHKSHKTNFNQWGWDWETAEEEFLTLTHPVVVAAQGLQFK